MLTAESSARVVRMEYQGLVYFPVVHNGIVLGPEELARLVATPAPVARARRVAAIVAHEASPPDKKPLRIRQGPGISPALSAREIFKWMGKASHGRQATPARPIPMTYGLSDYTIGCIEDPHVIPSGATFEGVDGPLIVATGRLYQNALAEIVWPAIKGGLVRGLCVEHCSDDRLELQDITRVTLGGLENNCLPGAVIYKTWEGEAP